MKSEVLKYDLIVIGGGTAGVSTAIAASRGGLKVLLIEKNTFLGGSMTASLVVPMMRNISFRNKNSIVNEVLRRLSENKNSIIYSDGNPGWFNPEMMKCILEDICSEEDIDIIYNTVLTEVISENTNLIGIKCLCNSNSIYFESNHFVDATGDANLSSLAGVPIQPVVNSESQPVSLRFCMGGVDSIEFIDWLEKYDSDRGVSSIYRSDDSVHFSTAYTFDSDKWALAPLIDKGISRGLILPSDIKYFQIFSLVGQKGVVAFNCPRIDFAVNPLDASDCSKALILGRKAIRRIADFCKEMLPGFNDAFISNIATDLGVRVSRRIVGRHILSEEDIGKSVKVPVAEVDYPFDIHSNEENKSVMGKRQYYQIPLDCLRPVDFDNLFVVGRCISADFKMQSSLRIQPVCMDMGEFIGRYIPTII